MTDFLRNTYGKSINPIHKSCHRHPYRKYNIYIEAVSKLDKSNGRFCRAGARLFQTGALRGAGPIWRHIPYCAEIIAIENGFNCIKNRKVCGAPCRSILVARGGEKRRYVVAIARVRSTLSRVLRRRTKLYS